MDWLKRIRAEWSKNDGKPVEEWESGPDLKDTCLRTVAVIAGLIQIGLIVWWMASPIWE